MAQGYLLHNGRRARTGVYVPNPPVISGFGPRLGDWMAQTGDQVLTVPDGSTLNGDGVNLATATHAATGGRYNGWLIIKCATKGGSTLDLSDPGSGSYRGGLDLRYDAPSHGYVHLPLRILFLGFNIRGGEIVPIWINRLRLGWCDSSWADTVWQAYYDTLYSAAHGGAHPVPNPNTALDFNVFGPSVNWHATTLGGDQCMRDSGDPAGMPGIEAFFCDWHNVGDDAIYMSSTDLYLRGCRFDDIYHHGTNYKNNNTGGDLMHSDVVQLTGGTFKSRHCSFGGHLDIEAVAGGYSVVLDFDDFWSYGSSITGMSTAINGSNRTITGTMTNGKWGGHGQYYHDGVNPATQSVPYYEVGADRVMQGDWGYSGPPGLTWDGTSLSSWEAGHKISALDLAQVTGSGTPGQNGLLTPDLATPLPGSYPNVPTLRDSVRNPAVIDQAANPYSSWQTFMDAYGWT